MFAQLVRTNRALILILMGLFLVTAPFMKISYEVTSQTCSPTELAYDAFAPYCAGTVKTRYVFKTTCAVRVVKQIDDLATGYGTRHSVHPKVCGEGAPVFAWGANGVTITHTFGNLTVDKGEFIGGR